MKLVVALFTLVGLIGSVPLTAQDQTSPKTDAPEKVVFDAGSSSESSDADQEGYRLSLNEAIHLAVEHSLDIKGEVIKVRRSEWGVTSAKGAFDVLVNANLNWNETERAVTSALASSQSESQSYSVGAGQLVSTGGSWSARLTNTRSDLPGFVFVTQTPTYDSSLNLNFNQPLLRNFGREKTHLQIKLAENSLQTSIQGERQGLMTALSLVEDTYWSLLFSLEDLAVKRKSLKLAEDFFGQQKARCEVGVLAPIELAQAEASVANRRQAIIQGEASVQNLEDQLRLALNLPLDHPINNRSIYPSTKPSPVAPDYDLEHLYNQAKTHRPDLLQAELAMNSSERLVKSARNSRRPQLDLALGLTYQGAAADDTVLMVDSNFSDAMDQVWGRDNQSWSVGFNFSYPLRNRSLDAGYQQAKLDLTLQEIGNAKLNAFAYTQVRSARRSVVTAFRQIEASKVNVMLQEKNVFAEQKKYENGLSTSFEVLSAQETLESAESGLLSAEVAYMKAVMNLKQIIGTLLDQYGVEVMQEDWRPVIK